MRARLFSGWKTAHWVFLGLGVLAVLLLVGFAWLVVYLAVAFDTDRGLKDFESPQQSRDFVSAHLPTPLPATAVVTELLYERWTDWHLTARVRLEGAAAVDAFIGQARLSRTLNDAYCGVDEPGGRVRYFLPKSSACCAVGVAAEPGALDVSCYTR